MLMAKKSWVAFTICCALWLLALLLTALVSYVGFTVFRSAPMLSAVSFLLALPAALLGIKSYRVSAAALVGLMLWDLVTTTWPHISLNGLFSSMIDVVLLAGAMMAVLVALISPFRSGSALIQFLKTKDRSQMSN